MRPRIRMALLGVLSATASVSAQTADLVGRWEGALDAGGVSIPVVLRMEEASEGIRALLDSPSQGAFGLVGDVTVYGDSLTVRLPSVGSTYLARVVEDRLEGTWRQGGSAIALVLVRAGESPQFERLEDPSGFAGDWGGQLDMGIMEVALVLHLAFDGTHYVASLDSPDQGAFGIPAEASVEGDILSVTIPAAAATLRGRLQDGAIQAMFNQGGADHPVRLTREGAVIQRTRPQDPRGPFPFEVEEVTFDSEPGVILAGTVTRPAGDGPFPAAVLVSGSGPQDRDESIMGHRPFAVLADYLTRRGVLVLRYDDRGVGASTGDFSQATTEDFAVDAAAAVRHAAARPDVSAVGIVGHSEGGIVGPNVAATEDVAYLILLAGSAVPGYSIIAHQGGRLARAEGLSASAAVAQERIIADALVRVAAVPLHTPIPDSVRASVLAAFRSVYAARSDEDRAATGSSDSTAADAELVASVERIDMPWLRYFLAYDPAPALRALDVPVLALFGELDLQVTPEQNAGPMREALAASASPNWTVETIPRANHLFQTADTGSIREYATIEETMNPNVLERVADWILNVSR